MIEGRTVQSDGCVLEHAFTEMESAMHCSGEAISL